MSIKNDILKENGIYSIKRIIAITTYVVILFLVIFIGIVAVCFNLNVNIYAIQIFTSLLGFLILLLGITEVGKKFTTKTDL